MSYEERFEDAVELCMDEVERSPNKQAVVQRLKHILGLVKEHKFERMKRMLGPI
jgi:hypothetical protein